MVLLDMARHLHRTGEDDEYLRRIYGYASWCAANPEKNVWNSVAVSFYEHLWDDPSLDDAIKPWINARIYNDYWGLWELMLSPERLAAIAKKLGRKPPVGR